MAAGGQGLRRHHDLAGHIQGVRPQLRGGDMGVDAVDDDLEAVHRCVVGACRHADGAHRQVGRCMQAEHPLHAVQMTIPDELLRTLADLLSGLEEQPDRAAEVRLLGGQQLRRAQQGSGVRVVAAGVHHAGRLGFIGHLVGLGDGQRVDVGPQGDDTGAGPLTLDLGVDAGLAAAPVGDAELIQLLLNALRGAVFLQADLRVCVEIAPERYDVILFGQSLLCDGHLQNLSFPDTKMPGSRMFSFRADTIQRRLFTHRALRPLSARTACFPRMHSMPGDPTFDSNTFRIPSSWCALLSPSIL